MSSQGILLETLTEPYLESRSLRLNAPTLGQERRYLLRFLLSLKEQGVTEVQAVCEEHVAHFYSVLSSSPGPFGVALSRSFLQQALLCARSFLVWAHERGLLLRDFGDLAIPKRNDVLPLVPTADEMKRLLEQPGSSPTDKRDRLLLELLYVLGLRAGECVRLDLYDADLSAETLTVVGKGGHQRLVPLSVGICACMLDYLNFGRPRLAPSLGEAALFVSGKTKRRLDAQSVRLRVRAHGARIGLKLGAHQLRHACATHLIEGGAELVYVARLLGHQKLKTTGRYARVRPLELASEHRRCHPRAIGGLND